MTKIKTSLSIKRQIPEYIKTQYPLFVDFVKSYYDFLENTQSQDLESFKSLDTTLDEFILRFKEELASNIPVNLAYDQRELMKHIREFYLSRGSEASFKFLFKTLYGKDASLFYPSERILRASDGKWRQDTSIFVKATSTDKNLYNFKDKFVNINNGNKTIQIYVNNVIQYDLETYEVFIDRTLIRDITIGSQVSLTSSGITYSGVVLKTPTKVSIIKKGTGFKVGDIYKLSTSLGDGCVIKITRVDSAGGILAIQLIRFGLHYETDFWSYLSAEEYSENQVPFEITTGNLAVNENFPGFVETGFATKQTYMYYDPNIPVGSNSEAADRYYAEGTYVGDLEAQFYLDQTTQDFSANYAVIKVSVGAVAVYPGYYESSDGFISDEMYIHDGNYYQAFSYVIRVEEELRKYVDLVKSVLHPSGMKMFAEYNILNYIELSFVPPFAFRIIQLTDSIENILDRGFNYTAYTSSIDGSGTVTVEPAVGAGIVNSKNGKAALRPTKNINSIQTFSTIAGRVEALFDANADHIEKIDVEKTLNDNVENESRGFNYDSYDVTIEESTGVITSSVPSAGANQVISNLNKAALYAYKKLPNDNVSASTTLANHAQLNNQPDLYPHPKLNDALLSPVSGGFAYTDYTSSIDGGGNVTVAPAGGATVVYTDITKSYSSQRPTKNVNSNVGNSTDGRVVLNPYSLTEDGQVNSYFVTFENYQPSTNIT